MARCKYTGRMPGGGRAPAPTEAELQRRERVRQRLERRPALLVSADSGEPDKWRRDDRLLLLMQATNRVHDARSLGDVRAVFDELLSICEAFGDEGVRMLKRVVKAGLAVCRKELGPMVLRSVGKAQFPRKLRTTPGSAPPPPGLWRQTPGK